jgi:hypothetical protein
MVALLLALRFPIPNQRLGDPRPIIATHFWCVFNTETGAFAYIIYSGCTQAILLIRSLLVR